MVTSHLAAPSALTVDPASDRLFWADVELRHLESSNLDGGDRRVVVSAGVVEPMGVAVLGEWLYWADRGHQAVLRANKFKGERR